MQLTVIYAILLALVLAAVHAATPSGNYCDISLYPPGNGSQIPDKATCVSTALGDIPDIQHMTSTLILFPKPETTIKANNPFTAVVKVTNLETGNFLDPNTDYYKFSQQLNKDGTIKGHLHITIQKLENLDTPPDPSVFAFFEGLNDKADKSGVLKQEVDKLSPGLYRICTLSASASHAPLVMPVAKRGAQDDCVRFTVK